MLRVNTKVRLDGRAFRTPISSLAERSVIARQLFLWGLVEAEEVSFGVLKGGDEAHALSDFGFGEGDGASGRGDFGEGIVDGVDGDVVMKCFLVGGDLATRSIIAI